VPVSMEPAVNPYKPFALSFATSFIRAPSSWGNAGEIAISHSSHSGAAVHGLSKTKHDFI